MKEPTDLLDNIKKVTPPAFLLDQIMQEIEREKREYILPRQAFAIAASFALLIAVNFFAMDKYAGKNNNVKALAESVSTNNQLY